MELFYSEERNTNFYNICEKIRKDTKEYMSVKDIASMAVRVPAESFFISLHQINIIIMEQRCGKTPPKGIKGELHKEIFKTYWELKKQNPSLCVNQIAKLIEEMPAPRFYMSNATATSLYYELIKSYSKKNAISNRNKFYNRVFGA
jgi:hypothetical protein